MEVLFQRKSKEKAKDLELALPFSKKGKVLKSHFGKSASRKTG